MKTLSTLTAMVMTALLLSFAFAAEAGEVKKDLKTTDYGLAAHLKSIPAEYRKQVKATHHLAVVVSDTKGDQVTDATVSYTFKQGDKVVAEGKLAYMAASMPAEGEHKHHMSAGLEGMQNMEPTCPHNDAHPANCGMPGCPRKEGAGGHYGADLTIAPVGKQTLTLTVVLGKKTQSASAEIVVPE